MIFGDVPRFLQVNPVASGGVGLRGVKGSSSSGCWESIKRVRDRFLDVLVGFEWSLRVLPAVHLEVLR